MPGVLDISAPRWVLESRASPIGICIILNRHKRGKWESFINSYRFASLKGMRKGSKTTTIGLPKTVGNGESPLEMLKSIKSNKGPQSGLFIS